MSDLNAETTPSNEEAPEALCPSCGRFVGPYETCPYCGARLKKRLSVRVVKIAAVLLATVGLIGLWLAARFTEIPVLSAEMAQGTMNMAYVKVQGRVARSVTYDPEGQYFAFWVDDGTGEIRVASYRDVTEALLASGRIPALGDEVEVAGTLRIREDYVSLTLNVPEHLELKRPEPLEMKAEEVNPLDEGRRVRVSGDVSRVFSPYDGLTIIYVRDDSGQIAVAVDEVLTQLTGPLPELIVEGQPVEVEGTVTLYKDTPQLVPSNVADLKFGTAPAAAAAGETAGESTGEGDAKPEPEPEPEPELEPLALNEISEEDAGEWVLVAGRIVAMEGFQGGIKATLDDGTEQIIILLWESIYSELENPQTLDAGAEVEVRGEVKVYRDELEVVPAAPEDLLVTAPAPEIEWVDAQALSTADVDRLVRMRGVLGTPDAFSAGIKVSLDDGTGTVTVLLWSNVAEALAQPPEEGMVVEVIGTVAEYKGELEIIPRSPFDWHPGQ